MGGLKNVRDGDYKKRRANEYNLKPTSLAEYDRHLGPLVAQFGDVPIRDFDEEHVCTFLGMCAPGSLSSRFSVLAAMLRWADRKVLEGLADLVPERRPARRWRTRWLSSVEFLTIWTWIDERQSRPRARARTLDACRLGMICPLRRSEIVTLTVKEVDLEGSRLHLFDTKSGNRVVPLSPMARAICRRLMLQTGHYLLPARGQQSGHMDAGSLSRAWKRIARACRIDDVTLHDCRRTWASQAIQNGVSLEYVRRILGHSTEWMSIQYAHVADDRLQGAADHVEFVLLGGVR